MKIFISHSSKDKDLAISLSSFLESVAPSVEVFCSSQSGSIRVGQNFVHSITEALKNCNVFIPLLSPNYYTSRFCMIELGFAYSLLVQNFSNDVSSNVFPIAIPPVKKGEALSGTPLAELQVSSINDIDDMRVCLESIFENSSISLKAGLNRKMNEFVYDIKQKVFNKFDINSHAKQLVCKSQNVPGEDGDYLSYSVIPGGKGYTINFRAKPFGESLPYPDFLSFVYQYVDKIDLYEPALLFEDAKLRFCINNFTNSISKIDIEIKCSANNVILYRRTLSLHDGENPVAIPLSELRYEASKNISEICFVIHPPAYVEEEGMFQIKDFEIACI